MFFTFFHFNLHINSKSWRKSLSRQLKSQGTLRWKMFQHLNSFSRPINKHLEKLFFLKLTLSYIISFNRLVKQFLTSLFNWNLIDGNWSQSFINLRLAFHFFAHFFLCFPTALKEIRKKLLNWTNLLPKLSQ